MKAIISGLSILAWQAFAATATPSVVTEISKAATCPKSMPVIIASKTLDGDTEINAWAATPMADVILIGGTTYSRDITETNDECVAGCAIVGGWKKNNNSWLGRYVYTNMRGVLAVKTNFNTKKSVILFSRSLDSGIKAFAFGFIDWQPNDTPQNMFMVQVGWQTKFPYDEKNWNSFSNYFILGDDRMHLIANHPNENEVTDLWFILGDDKTSIRYAYKEDMTLKRNDKETKFVSPTRKYNMMPGYSNENVLQFAQITLPKGGNQLGKSLTLDETTTYTCIISRTWQPIDRQRQQQEAYLFKMRDRIYSWKQESESDFYSYPAASTYVAPTGGHFLYGAGSNSLRAYEILVSGFTYQKTHTVTHQYTKRFAVGESNAVQCIAVQQNTMSTDPYRLYVVYLIPAEGFRGKILNLKLDTILSTTSQDKIQQPLTYYFMRPIVEVKGQIWNQQPLFFHYDRMEDSFYYAGRTNYIEGPSNKLYEKVTVDWTQDRLNFGFINQYTPNQVCKTNLVKDKEENIYRFGTTHFQQQEYGQTVTWLQALDNNWNYTEVGMEDGSPVEGWWREPKQLEIVNMNSSNWEELEKENGGKEFDVQYNDWINPRFGAKQYIKRLIGLNWLDKFQLNRDTYRTVETSQGEIASIWMFAISCVNLVVGIIIEAVAVPPRGGKVGEGRMMKSYQVAMLTTALFHQLLWMPILVLWIIVHVTQGNLGKDHKSNIGWMEWVVLFTDVTGWCRYIGVYGGYGAMFLFIFLTAYLLPVFRVDTGYNGDFGSALGISFLYLIYGGANVFAHEFFAPQLQLWSSYFKKVIAEGSKPHDETKEGEDAKKDQSQRDRDNFEEDPTAEGDSFDLNLDNWSRKNGATDHISDIMSSLHVIRERFETGMEF